MDESEDRRAVLIVDDSARIQFCSALRSPIWAHLVCDRVEIDEDGSVAAGDALPCAFDDGLAARLEGTSIEALLPGIQFLWWIRDIESTREDARLEYSATAETGVGDIEVSATARRVSTSWPLLYEVEITISEPNRDWPLASHIPSVDRWNVPVM